MAENVETLGVDPRTKTKKLGAQEMASRKKCDLRFSLISNFLDEDGLGFCESWEDQPWVSRPQIG